LREAIRALPQRMPGVAAPGSEEERPP
jgi:hypothetical protein